jgi:hypothetical protein
MAALKGDFNGSANMYKPTSSSFPSHHSFMMGVEMVFEMLDFCSRLMQLATQEDFMTCSHSEIFKVLHL